MLSIAINNKKYVAPARQHAQKQHKQYERSQPRTQHGEWHDWMLVSLSASTMLSILFFISIIQMIETMRLVPETPVPNLFAAGSSVFFALITWGMATRQRYRFASVIVLSFLCAGLVFWLFGLTEARILITSNL